MTIETPCRTQRLVVVFAVLLSLGWLAPNHYPPWTAFHSDWMAALALAAAVIGSVLKVRGAQPVPVPAVMVAVVALIPVMQWSLGKIHFAGDAWLAALYVLGLAFAIQFGFSIRQRLQDDVQSVEPLAWALVVVAGVSAVFSLCQWLRIPVSGMFMMEMRPNGQPYANFAQPNQLATFLMMGLVGALLLHQWRRLTAFTLSVLILLFCAALSLTQSRTAWIEMGVLVSALCLLRCRVGLRIPALGVMSIGGVLFLCAALVPWLGDALLLSSRGAAQLQAGTRPIHWATVLDAISLHPWLGYGWNQVSVAVAHSATNHPASHEMVEHSHNLLLDLLAWNGVPLGLVIVSGGVWWLWRQVATCRDATQALLLAIVAMPLVHSMVEFPLEYAYLLIPVGFLMGVLQASRQRARVLHVPHAAMAALAVAGVVVVAWIGVEYLQVEDNTRQLRFESARIGIARIESSAPQVLLLTQQREFLRFARTEATRGMSNEQLDWMRKVAERYGYPPVLFRYALATALNGRDDVARQTLARLCKIHPEFLCDEARMNWAALAAGPYPELEAITVPVSH